MTTLTRIGLVAAAACLGASLGACSATRHESVFVVLPGEYAAAFDATRDTLAEARFTLDRVDAAGGVITTQPKATGGIATPWDLEQSTLGQEWEDLTNQQEREVRVTFAPEGADDAVPGPGEALPDRRGDDRALVGRVEVTVLRVRRPGWRPATEAVSRSSRADDPVLEARAGGSTFREPIGRDDLLAGRLAQRIRERLGDAPVVDPGG